MNPYVCSFIENVIKASDNIFFFDLYLISIDYLIDCFNDII